LNSCLFCAYTKYIFGNTEVAKLDPAATDALCMLPPKKNGPTWNVEMDPLGNCMFWGMGLEM